MRKIVGLVVLCASCALAAYVFLNNPDMNVVMAQLGSKPKASTVATPYQTEQAWATGEIGCSGVLSSGFSFSSSSSSNWRKEMLRLEIG